MRLEAIFRKNQGKLVYVIKNAGIIDFSIVPNSTKNKINSKRLGSLIK